MLEGESFIELRDGALQRSGVVASNNDVVNINQQVNSVMVGVEDKQGGITLTGFEPEE
jgi:hypothetical protein